MFSVTKFPISRAVFLFWVVRCYLIFPINFKFTSVEKKLSATITFIFLFYTKNFVHNVFHTKLISKYLKLDVTPL